ncbi:hypothetical protein PJM42_0012 [Salmonella phage vB_SenP_UTK0001]|nr:hypothetical protein PJM42_0012 [Salmonella phage vB_SenP_UTK0001]
MNHDLLLILSSIKNALGTGRDMQQSADNLCDSIHDINPERCQSLNCVDCIVGYKYSTQYAHQVIQTWKVL